MLRTIRQSMILEEKTESSFIIFEVKQNFNEFLNLKKILRFLIVLFFHVKYLDKLLKIYFYEFLDIFSKYF